MPAAEPVVVKLVAEPGGQGVDVVVIQVQPSGHQGLISAYWRASRSYGWTHFRPRRRTCQ